MNILVIGGGNMGLTYANSINQNSKKSNISIVEKDENKILELRNQTPFAIYNNVSECIAENDIILLAIKPQISNLVFKDLNNLISKDQIIISIMAGITIEAISKGLGIQKIVRAMPNLPSQVGHGVTGFYVSEAISKSEAILVDNILSATGKIIKVDKEDEIDTITALSGSGPAYVFYFMNAMIEQAEIFGFSSKEAKSIVLNTFLGTAELFKNSEENASTWIDKVTSKGGTTHAALTNFKNKKIDESIKLGVKAAYNRAKELAKN